MSPRVPVFASLIKSDVFPFSCREGRHLFVFKNPKKKFNTLSPNGLRLRVARTVLNPTEFKSIPKFEHNVENEVEKIS